MNKKDDNKEGFVAESLKKHYSKDKNQVDFEEAKEDHPDFYLTINDKKIGIEVTKLDYNLINGLKTKYKSIEEFSKNLRKKYNELIPKDTSILIAFQSFEKFSSKFFKQFEKFFKSFIEEEMKVIDLIEFDIYIKEPSNTKNFPVNIKILKDKKRECRIHIAYIHNLVKTYKGDIKKMEEAKKYIFKKIFENYVLNERIKIKNYKYKDFKETIYLAFYYELPYENGNPLYDFKKVNIIHNKFEKVFIVYPNEKVIELK